MSSLVPLEHEYSDSIGYFPEIRAISGIDPLLIKAADGWHAFDGESLTALPTLRADRIGDFSGIRRVGPIVLAQSHAGIFVINDDLTAERVDAFPAEEPFRHRVAIEYLEQAHLFVVVTAGSDTVYVSSDFEHFEPVQSPSVLRVVAEPLPDRPGLLLVGSDGLYTFEAVCPDSGN